MLSQEFLVNVNDYLIPYSGDYCKTLKNEAFYTQILAHMAKHIVHGGSGVRSFLDIWLINKNWQFDRQNLDKMLLQNNLLGLDKAISHLTKVWFENETHTELTSNLEEYVLNGGIYGNIENQVAVSKAKTGGKSSGLLSKIFLPYSQLKFTYPVLQKHKWLTPLFEVFRWFRIIFKGRSKILAKQLKANKTVTEEKADKTANLLKQLGL